MQGSTAGSSKSASTSSLHNIAENVKDSAEQVVSDLSAKKSKIASEAPEVMEEYYDTASSWLQQNYGKTLGMVGFLAAAGAIGYYMGKNSGRGSFDKFKPSELK